MGTLFGQRRRGAFASVGRAAAWLVCCLVLFLANAAPANAQAHTDGRPAGWRICDIDVTIVQGQRFERDANVDMANGPCTATAFPGTRYFLQGFTGPNTVAAATAAGRDDLYPTYGTTAPVSSGPAAAAGRWGSADNTYAFAFQSNATAAANGAVVDHFEVEVVNTNGQARGRIYYHVTILPPAPTATAISPLAGPSTGGTAITIDGTNFTQTGTTVTIGGNAATNVTFVSSIRLTAQTPAGTAGARRVTVTTSGGASANALDFTYTAPIGNAVAVGASPIATGGSTPLTITLTNPSGNPALAAVASTVTLPTSPGALVVAATPGVTNSCGGMLTATPGAGTISLTGGTLAAGASCSFGAAVTTNVAGSYTVSSGTATSTTTAAGTAGTAALVVSTPPPTITGVAPGVGPVGTTVTIDGTNLTGTSAVRFGTTPASSFAFVSASRVTAVAPPGSGTVDIALDTPGGTATRTAAFRYYPAPTITGFSPTNGSLLGRTQVIVTGSNLLPANGTPNVTFGGRTAIVDPGDSQSASRVVVYTPTPAGAGAVSVQAITEGGTVTASGSFTYVGTPAAPTVVAPANGASINVRRPVVQGTAQANSFVTVYIDNQVRGTGTAGGTGSFAITSTADLADGSHPVRADARPTSDSDAVSPSSPTNIFIVDTAAPAAPAITMPLDGATTTSRRPAISGSAEANSRVAITIDTAAPQTVIADANGLFSYTPTADLGIGRHSVSATATDAANNVSIASAAVGFTIVGTPAVSGVSPDSGPNAGGTPVTISGSNFAAGATVTFAGVQATNVVVASATTITATTPPIAGSGPVDVTVTTGAGSGTRTGGFSYLAPPAAPVLTAPADNATIASRTPTYTGTATDGATVAVFVDGGQVGTTTATGGAFSLTQPTPLGDAGHTVYATATTAGGTSAASNTIRFTVDAAAPAAPTITAPANGATIAARRPAVTGSAESGSIVSVTFNGSPAGTTTASGGSYSFTPTADLPTGSNTVAVFATDAAGNQSPTASSSFTIVAQPTVTGVSPPEGPVAGGTVITVTGTNLTGVTAVSVGGSPATEVAVTGSGTVTARTPAGTAGTAAVTVTNQAGTSSGGGSFAYVAPPIATDQTVPVAYNTRTNLTVTASDPNTPARPLSFELVTPPAHAAVFNGTFPNFQYTPTDGYNGTDSLTYRVSNGFGSSNPATVTFTVAAPAVTISGTPPAGRIGAAYSATLTASGGSTPYSFALATGSQPLPGGLRLRPTGATTVVIEGTPTQAGTFPIAVRAVDSSQPAASATQAYELVIARAQQTVAFTSSPPAGAVVGGSYAVTASASSNLTPVITIDAAASAICTITGGTVTFRQAGVCVINANQPGDAGVDPAPQVQQSVTVGQPTIVVDPPALPAGGVGAPYSTAVGATGGAAPYRFDVTAGALPAGLALDRDSGRISGTPTQGGAIGFTITATDSSTGTGAPYAGSRAYTLAVQAPAITLAPTTLPAGVGGQAYRQPLTASGGTAPYTYTTAGPLPAGLSLSVTGELAGTPTQTGSFTFDVIATDSSTGGPQPGGRYAGTQRYTLAIGRPAITVAPPTLPGATVGAPYAIDFTASGGGASYTYSLVGTGRPPAGLTLTGSGRLAGTPTAGGSFPFIVRATDPDGFSGEQAYTLAVAAATVVLIPETLPNGTRNVDYSAALSGTGGTAPYRYALTGGSLPPGLTVAGNGVLAGRPTTAGSFTFTITATDASTGSGPYSGGRSYTVAIDAPPIDIMPRTLPAATTRVAYSQALTASFGAAPYGYAVTAGALPAGFTLTTGGLLSGTTTAAGSFTFTMTATDANGNSGGRQYTLTVTAPAIAIAPDTLPNATTRTGYSQALTASGGTAPYGFAVTAGALPAGLTLSTAGVLSGSTNVAGSYAFTATATDADGNAGTRSYTLAVTAPAITIAPAALPNAQVAIGYSQMLTASGGAGGYGFAITAGVLPAGLTLAPDGTLAGTPTAGGSFTFTATATDASGNAGSRSYALTVDAATVAIVTQTLPDAVRNVNYGQTLTAAGGTAPYSYAVTAGTLPPGLTLSSGGALAGRPTTSGSFTFSVTARDASTGTGPYAGTRTFTLAVSAPAVTIAPATLPAATTRIAYRQDLSASGGTAPYGYAVTAGALPAGITLSAAGTLSGTATNAGSFGFTVTATDANGNVGNRPYTLEVAAPTIALAPATLPAATTRIAYRQELSASGGTAPYGYAVTAGALPAGITLSAAGSLAGTATTAGSFGFTVTVTDANGNAGSRAYTLEVAAPTIALSPATLAAANVGTAYSATLAASGGTAPYAYAVTAGALPAGLTLANGGALTGTPTAGGSYTFTATVTDASGNAGSRAYTLEATAATVTVTPPQLPAATTGVAYAQTLAAGGGTAPYSFAVTAGALPAGLTLSSAGALSGTPSVAGSYTFTATATDASTGSGPYRGATSYTLTVGQRSQTIAFATPGTRRLDQSPVALAATASSGLPVGFASTTAAICTVAGNDATLLRSGTCTIVASQAGNAEFAPAPDVVQSFQVDPPLLTAMVARASVAAAVGAPLDPVAPVTASGGTAPYGYSLSGPLPAGLSFAPATGQLSGTATAGQAATRYTVTVTDAAGQTASAGFALTVAAPTLTLTPATLPEGSFEVAYRQQLSAAGGVAPYRYAVTAGALPAGLTLSAQGELTGTPTASGTFDITVTATDSATGTGPYSVAARYALVIRPPAAPIAGNVAATVGYGSSDNVIAPQLAGGTTTALAIATQPTSGSVRIDGRTFVYTPRAGFGGSDGFAYTASNAGGTSAPATVSVTVTAPTVAITTAGLPNAQQNVAYSQQLAASGGTAPYAYAVTAGSLPGGLTLSPGGLLAGTPTTSGRASFTITVTDASTGAGPFRGSQAYTLAVDLPAPPTLAAVPALSTAGSTAIATTPVQVVLSDYAAGEFTAIEITAQPRGGTVTLSQAAGGRFVAVYTPRVGFAGSDSFAFVAVGPGGRSAPATVTIQVVGAVPVAAALTATTTQGVPVTVDLTGGAGGGPFTAARVTAIAPAGSLATQLVEGGSAGNRSYRLTITPTLSYSGTATVSYALSNAFGESAAATVTVAVAARPDPSADPTVNALSTAQADATRRFAGAQLQNFARRNEQLHNGGGNSGGYSANLSVTGGDPVRGIARQNQDAFLLATQGHAREVAGAEYANGALVRAGEGGFVAVAGERGRVATGEAAGGRSVTAGAGGTEPAAGQEPGTGEAAAPGGRRVGSVAIWSGGAIAVGTRDATTQRDKLRVTTGGLSSGVDVKLSEGLIVGVGGGYGADKTRVNGGEAQVKGDAWSVAAYGSWSPRPGLFIDGVFGGGQLDFDTRRLVAQTNTVAIGGRDGHMLFGSLAFGFDRRLTRFDLALYGRFDVLSAELDRYIESGGGIYGLSFAERDLTSVLGIAGGRVAFPLGGAIGRLRGEYRHEFNATGAQLVDYADIVNLRYRTRGDQWLRNAFSLDAELEAPLGRGWTGGIGGGVAAGSGAVAGTGRVELRKQFR